MTGLLEQANRVFKASGLARYRSPRQKFELELLDQDQTKEVFAGTFRDLRRINRWFGGWSLVEHNLRPFLPPAGKIKVLDLAAGVADVPLALARKWHKRNIELDITAVDLNPIIIELAEEAARHEKQPVQFHGITANVFHYPWPAGQTYDFVTCSLAFHHFPASECVRMLELMAQLSGRAFVVNDLRRGWFGVIGAQFLIHTITRDPINQHDAPLSVFRAFTLTEMKQLVAQAHFPPGMTVTVKRQPFSRLAIVGSYT